jgi:hypothetical protein
MIPEGFLKHFSDSFGILFSIDRGKIQKKKIIETF